MTKTGKKTSAQKRITGPRLNTGAVSVSAGGQHTCALMSGGTAKCWGEHLHGQLGNGTGGFPAVSNTPVDVSGDISEFVAIAAGRSHTCALTSAESLKCWEWNGFGQLGEGTSTWQNFVPVDATEFENGMISLTAGSGHTCAVTKLLKIVCVGSHMFSATESVPAGF